MRFAMVAGMTAPLAPSAPTAMFTSDEPDSARWMISLREPLRMYSANARTSAASWVSAVMSSGTTRRARWFSMRSMVAP